MRLHVALAALAAASSSARAAELLEEEAPLVVGGDFVYAGGAACSRVAQWREGGRWTCVGAGLPQYFVSSLVEVDDGTVYAGGSLSLSWTSPTANDVAAWNGTTWTACGPPQAGNNFEPKKLIVFDGAIHACSYSPAISRFNGTHWAAVGTELGFSCYATAIFRDTLYAGGRIYMLGDGVCGGIAVLSGGASWSLVGRGVGGDVWALAAHGDLLVVGGDFDATCNLEGVRGVSAPHIAAWNGSAWAPLGSGTDDIVSALLSYGGVLYAGGEFTVAGGVTVNAVAQWDGAAWAALGLGMGTTGNYILMVNALEVYAGHVYAAGQFFTADGQSALNVARWNGSAWSAVDFGMTSPVNTLAVVSSSDRASGASGGANVDSDAGVLYAGGGFLNVGAMYVNRVALWSSASGSAATSEGSWATMESGVNSPVLTFARVGEDIYAGGSFSEAGGRPASRVARWENGAWAPLGAGVSSTVNALVAYNGDVIAGGSFTSAGGQPALSVARWNGTAWAAVDTGMGPTGGLGTVYALATYGDTFCAGGAFTLAGSISAARVACVDAATGRWAALGAGVSNNVYALVADTLGNLYAGGLFTSAGGSPAAYVARWDGAAWGPLGTGLGGTVRVLVVWKGVLYAGGEFNSAGTTRSVNRVASYNGTAWQPLSTGVAGTAVYALAPHGAVLCAGGLFTNSSSFVGLANNIACWDGTDWSPVGTGTINAVRALLGSTACAEGWTGTACAERLPATCEPNCGKVDAQNVVLGVSIAVGSALVLLGVVAAGRALYRRIQAQPPYRELPSL